MESNVYSVEAPPVVEPVGGSTPISFDRFILMALTSPGSGLLIRSAIHAGHRTLEAQEEVVVAKAS